MNDRRTDRVGMPAIWPRSKRAIPDTPVCVYVCKHVPETKTTVCVACMSACVCMCLDLLKRQKGTGKVKKEMEKEFVFKKGI